MISIVNVASWTLLLQTVLFYHTFLCLNPLRVQQLTYCPSDMHSVRTHQALHVLATCPLVCHCVDHDAEEIWKRSFMSTVRPTVHTNPSRKRSFISTVRHTVHTNPSRKWSFLETLLKRKEFENAGFVCENWGSFSNTMASRFPWPSFPQAQL